MTRVSVVIPAYNRAQTIERCLLSVCRQSVTPYEIIVVDDASTDQTCSIVEHLAATYSNIVLYRLMERSGAQAARNHGIRKAMGDWIAFQDSDDEWVGNKLELQLREVERYSCDPFLLIHGDAWRNEDADNDWRYWRIPTVDGSTPVVALLRGPGPLFPSFLTSKAALEHIGYLDESVPSYQEWDTAIRLAAVCRFVHLHEALFVYHLHAGETISKDMGRDLDGYGYIVNKHRQAIMEVLGVAGLRAHVGRSADRAMRYGLDREASAIMRDAPGWSLPLQVLRLLAWLGIGSQVYALLAGSPPLSSLLRRLWAVDNR
jgi:glycosyltransferase involved in cell wall biosynthesis